MDLLFTISLTTMLQILGEYFDVNEYSAICICIEDKSTARLVYFCSPVVQEKTYLWNV